MKANLIITGIAVLALAVLTGAGMMGCGSNPVSCQNEENETSVNPNAVDTSSQAVFDQTAATIIMGRLLLDESGVCWYLIVQPGEIYELQTNRRLQASASGAEAIVEGFIQYDMQSHCSNYAVLSAGYINILDRDRPNPLRPHKRCK